MITYLGTDITAQEEYFAQLVADDAGLHSFLFESGEDIEEFYERTKAPGFRYPVLVLFMPFVEMDDNGYGLIEAKQDNSFAVLVKPADTTRAAQNVAIREAQLMAFRVIGQIRKDARSGRFRLPDERRWRVRPMTNVGPSKACGVLIDFTIITNANALVGTSDNDY